MTLDQLIYDKLAALSPGQKKVAEYILENKESFSYATLAKLSKEIAVSETTIIRLSYSLGFDSFSAMQQKLREDILKTPSRVLSGTPAPNSTISNTLKKETDALLSWRLHWTRSRMPDCRHAPACRPAPCDRRPFFLQRGKLAGQPAGSASWKYIYHTGILRFQI